MPFLRMQAPKLAIAESHFACCAGDSDGGPPPGRYFRHASIADRNCGELGSTLPLNTTPPMLSCLAPALAAEPSEAVNPCDVMHVANLVLSPEPAVTDAAVVVCAVPILATDGCFDPPQPAATTPVTRSRGSRMLARVAPESGRVASR